MLIYNEENTSRIAISVEALPEPVEPTTKIIEGPTIAPSKCCWVKDEPLVEGIVVKSTHS